jgi:hypothetical protein
MISYKWSVEKVVVSALNEVTYVHWNCEGFDEKENLSASCVGVRELILGGSFTPYDELTEQKILDWCFASEIVTSIDPNGVTSTVSKNLKDEIEKQIAGQITRQLARKSEPVLPWKK